MCIVVLENSLWRSFGHALSSLRLYFLVKIQILQSTTELKYCGVHGVFWAFRDDISTISMIQKRQWVCVIFNKTTPIFLLALTSWQTVCSVCKEIIASTLPFIAKLTEKQKLNTCMQTAARTSQIWSRNSFINTDVVAAGLGFNCKMTLELGFILE